MISSIMKMITITISASKCRNRVRRGAAGQGNKFHSYAFKSISEYSRKQKHKKQWHNE